MSFLRVPLLFIIAFFLETPACAQYMRQPPEPGTIHRAAFDGDLNTLKGMLARNKALLDIASGKYGTPLQTAAGAGHENVVRFLLTAGANPNAAKTVGDNETVLMNASLVYPAQTESQKLNIVKLLVGKGARVKARDRNGMTALHYAASQASARIVAFLVSRGAEINAKTNADMTPLHYAAGYAPMGDNAIKTVKLLISKGADLRVKTQGQTLLQY